MANQNHMIKHSGQVFTPDFLVSTILDYAGYISGSILQSTLLTIVAVTGLSFAK